MYAASRMVEKTEILVDVLKKIVDRKKLSTLKMKCDIQRSYLCALLGMICDLKCKKSIKTTGNRCGVEKPHRPCHRRCRRSKPCTNSTAIWGRFLIGTMQKPSQLCLGILVCSSNICFHETLRYEYSCFGNFYITWYVEDVCYSLLVTIRI